MTLTPEERKERARIATERKRELGMNLGGRTPHEPTRDQRTAVKFMIAAGVPPKAIAREIGISEPTLYKHYRAEMDYGFESVKAAISAGIVHRAMRAFSIQERPGDLQCARWFMTVRAGWKMVGADDPTAPPPPSGDDRVIFVIPDNNRDKGPLLEGKAEAA
jgi:hypothetical protein